MHNKDGDIHFLGHSTNIKKRVNDHFIKRGDRARKLQKETKRVSFEKTGSALISLLKEQEELFKNKPRYNNKTKPRVFSHALYPGHTKEGYITLNVSHIDGNRKSITTFNSIHSAKNLVYKINEEFSLCDKLNGISEAKTSCSKYAEEKCKGACIQKEEIEEYNARVQQAIEKYSTANKSIIIVDKGREIGEYSAILIKEGKFIGLGYYDLNHQINNIAIFESIITPMKGD